MILFPPAKINLGLNVLSKREDGFHEIESCLYPIPLNDVIEILPADEFQFTSSGLLVDGDADNNLCVRAFELMRSNYSIAPVHIHLLKCIPMGAGLGGGSADATYVLRGLNDMFDLNLSVEALQEMAATLGSDCPFFVNDSAQMAKGRGEVLSKLDIDLSGYYLKVINPGIHIGTAEAYASVEFSNGDQLEEQLKQPIDAWQGTVKNSFEASIFRMYPEIKVVKEHLFAEGAIYAAMSGSGSTVFGIFKSRPTDQSQYEFVRVLEL